MQNEVGMKMRELLYSLLISSMVFCSQEWNGQLYDQNSDPQYETAINYLQNVNLNQFKKIASIGCGTARVEEWMAQNTLESTIFCFDASENMIECAQKKYGNYKNLYFKTMKAQEFSSNIKFNLIICFAVLHWIVYGEQQDTLKKLADHLSNDGHLHIKMAAENSKLPLQQIIEKIITTSSIWQQKLPNFLATPMHYPQTVNGMGTMLDKVGLSIIQIKQVMQEKKLASKEKFFDWFKAVSYGISAFQPLSDNERTVLLHEIVDEYIKVPGVLQQDGCILHKLPMLIVHAQKEGKHDKGYILKSDLEILRRNKKSKTLTKH